MIADDDAPIVAGVEDAQTADSPTLCRSINDHSLLSTYADIERLIERTAIHISFATESTHTMAPLCILQQDRTLSAEIMSVTATVALTAFVLFPPSHRYSAHR